MTDIHFAIGELGISAILMVAVLIALGRGRVYVVGILAFFGVAMVASAALVEAGTGYALAGLTSLVLGLGLGAAHRPLLGRLGGDPFIITNLLLLDVVRQLATQLQSNEGLTGLPSLPAGDRLGLIAFSVLLACGVFLGLSGGEWRRRFAALAAGEWALVEEGGQSPLDLQAVALTACGGLAGLAGFLMVVLHACTEPSRLAVAESVSVFAFCLVGGTNLVGAAVAAVLFTLPEVVLDEAMGGSSGVAKQQWQNLVIGAMLVLFLLYRPEGLAGDRAPFLPEGRDDLD